MASTRSRAPLCANAAPTGLRKRYLDGENGAAPGRQPSRHVHMNLDAMVHSAAQPGPDIHWNPSRETYLARVDRLAVQSPPRPKALPKGFPESVTAPWAWTGSEFEGETRYVVTLSDSDVAEIERGLGIFKGISSQPVPADVSRDTFPLPGLEGRLRAVAKNLHLGSGFNIIRGLDPTKYSPLDNVLIYLGITSHIAEKRGVQDSGGSMIIHIKDVGYQIPNSDMRQSPYARNAQPFHNDVCDILAMYVQEQAVEGGESYLASCAKVYNEIAASRPDVIHVLADDSWVFDKHRTPAYWNTRALLFNFEDKSPGFCFSRRPITGSPSSPRSAGVPPMTEVQAEAIDMVHFTAAEHSLSMRLRQGDIQLINNLAVFHARNGFRDSGTQRRHIMRLWLRNEELAWKTPQGLERTWFEKYGDSERRRIAKWNITPGATRERVLFRSDSCS